MQEKKLSKTSIPLALSLEDLLLMKDGFAIPEGSEVKSVKTRSLASVCHVGFSFVPLLDVILLFI